MYTMRQVMANGLRAGAGEEWEGDGEEAGRELEPA
jgi:hypothetical protein